LSESQRQKGISIDYHDIDIQSNGDGVYAIERALSEFVIRPVQWSSTACIRSHFGALRIEGIQVELMGDVQHRLADGRWDEPVEIARQRRWVSYGNLALPVLDLAYEYEAYLKIGRTETAALLRRRFDQRPG
jgi:hypothetical protein